MELCKICFKPAVNPFRLYSEGKIIGGCVSKFHTESLQGVLSANSTWHFSKNARQIRAKFKL